MSSFAATQPVVEVTRGQIVETVHFGALAVVDATGQLLASWGDPDLTTFMRSSAKPFQALPFVERDGDVHFGLEGQELALLCASHSGTDEHVRVVSSIQRKVGVSERNLLCGTHPPYHEPTFWELIRAGEQPGPNRHNCSGKHTGMLAHARLRGLPVENYIDPAHPVQQSILQAFAEMCGLPAEQVELGIDGCSAPNFAVPLRNAAWGFARLCDPAGLPAERAAACRRITQAMNANPNMVAGPQRYDTLLMDLASGRLVSKAGAEGYQSIGLLPGALGPGSPALGLAFKIADGDLMSRAAPCAMTAVLRDLGALSRQEAERLAVTFGPKAINNWRGIPVGEIRPVIQVAAPQFPA